MIGNVAVARDANVAVPCNWFSWDLVFSLVPTVQLTLYAPHPGIEPVGSSVVALSFTSRGKFILDT